MKTKNPAYILQRMYVGFIFMKQLGSMGTVPEWLNLRNVLTVVFLLAMFFVGRAIAYATTPTAGVVAQTENWGLGFGEKGTQPTGNESAETLKKYDAHYVGDSEEKVIYLTFDAGFENGNTEPILDALKKHNAKGTFFVVGHYLETAPELIKRMVEDGHTVGNHTYHHPDMSKISDKESFTKEMQDVESLYKEITGEEMVHYYRPPQGKYSTSNMEMAKELGYHTFFWSLAYVDWLQDDQPDEDAALQKLLSRTHPGAVVLLHSTSQTNARILDRLLTAWEQAGYRLAALDELFADPEYEWQLEGDTYYLYRGEVLYEAYSSDPDHSVSGFTPRHGGHDSNKVMVNFAKECNPKEEELAAAVNAKTLIFPAADVF